MSMGCILPSELYMGVGGVTLSPIRKPLVKPRMMYWHGPDGLSAECGCGGQCVEAWEVRCVLVQKNQSGVSDAERLLWLPPGSHTLRWSYIPIHAFYLSIIPFNNNHKINIIIFNRMQGGRPMSQLYNGAIVCFSRLVAGALNPANWGAVGTGRQAWVYLSDARHCCTSG